MKRKEPTTDHVGPTTTTTTQSKRSKYSSDRVLILLGCSISSELLLDKIRDVHDKAWRILRPIVEFMKEQEENICNSEMSIPNIDELVFQFKIDIIRDWKYIAKIIVKFTRLLIHLHNVGYDSVGYCCGFENSFIEVFNILQWWTYKPLIKKVLSKHVKDVIRIRILEKFQCDREIVLLAVKNGSALSNFPLFQNDREIAIEYIKHNNNRFEYISDQLKNDRLFLIEAVQTNFRIYRKIPVQFRSDKEIAIAALRTDGNNYKYVSNEIRNDKNLLLECRGSGLIRLDDTLLNDKEFMLEFVVNNPKCLSMTHQFWNDKEFVKEIVKLSDRSLSFIPNEFRNDRDVVMCAVQCAGYQLEKVCQELRNDRQVVMCAVLNNGMAIRTASDELKKDKEIALTSIYRNPNAISYLPDEMINDRLFILDAVQENGLILEHLPEKYKSDKEIVLHAVQQNGMSVKFASQELRRDKEIAMDSVQENGEAYWYIKYHDRDVILQAVITKPHFVLKESNKDLFYDFEVMKTIVESEYNLPHCDPMYGYYGI